MTRNEAAKEVVKHPKMIEYCKNNLFKVICSGECPHVKTCRALDWTNDVGTYPIYPYDFALTLEEKKEKYASGQYRFKAPPVCTALWGEASWIRWIDSGHGWTYPEHR